MVLAAPSLAASPALSRGLGLAVHEARSGPYALPLRGGRGCSARSWLTPSARPRLRAGDAEGGELVITGKFVVLVWSRSSPSARSGHVAAEAAVLEASFARRASRKDTGWFVLDPAGIPVSGRLATLSAARTAALLPVATAKAASPEARSKNAVRARRNMVTH